MLINIDRKTNLLVDIGHQKPTPELIKELRKKYMVGRMLSNLEGYNSPNRMNNTLRKDDNTD